MTLLAFFLVLTHSSLILGFHSDGHEYKNPQHYKNQAETWIQNYVSEIPLEDLILILNLTYLSWQRSQQNNELQEKISAVSHLHNDARYLFNAARRDPSHYARTHYPSTLTTIFLDYAQSLSEHEKIGRAYHYAVEHLIDGNVLTQNASVRVMRKNARSAVVSALMAMPHLPTFMKPANHTSLELADEHLADNPELKTTKEAKPKKLFTHITQFLSHVFAAADKGHSNADYQKAQKRITEQERYDTLWWIIDEVRSAFYQAHYKALYEHCINTGIQVRQLCLKIDEGGLHEHECLSLLPDSLSHTFAVS